MSFNCVCVIVCLCLVYTLITTPHHCMNANSAAAELLFRFAPFPTHPLKTYQGETEVLDDGEDADGEEEVFADNGGGGTAGTLDVTIGSTAMRMQVTSSTPTPTEITAQALSSSSSAAGAAAAAAASGTSAATAAAGGGNPLGAGFAQRAAERARGRAPPVPPPHPQHDPILFFHEARLCFLQTRDRKRTTYDNCEINI